MFDSYHNKVRKVVPILALCYADTPARSKLALTPGHSGRTPCDKCGIRSVRRLSTGQVLTHNAELGYDPPTHALMLRTREHNGVVAEEWTAEEVQYGKDKRFDSATAATYLISTTQHARRSMTAGQATSRVAQQHPLPHDAAIGGPLTSDPNSPEQRAITQSAFMLTASCACSRCPCRRSRPWMEFVVAQLSQDHGQL